MKQSYVQITEDVVHQAFNENIFLPTPYNYPDGNPIHIGDVVSLALTDLEGIKSIELGVIDFIKGCFLYVPFDSSPNEDPQLLHDFLPEMRKYKGDYKILLAEYIEERFVCRVG